MTSAGVLHRTPFRIAFALASVVLLAATIGALVGARLLESALEAHLDVAVHERFSEVEAEHDGGDSQALVTIVARYASVARGHSRIYRLHAFDGSVLVGEPGATLPVAGLSTAQNETAHYRLLRASIGDMILVVGLDDAENARIRQLVYRVCALATLVTLLVLIGGGTYLAHRAQRRLDGIGSSLERVGAGELSTRLPLSGRGDDIDAFASDVNLMLGELESLVAAVDQMSSDIAHDLKTPITRLFVSLDEALVDVAAGRNVRERLLDAQSELADINLTFEAMLRLSRIERGARRERFAVVPLSGLLADIHEHWLPVAESNEQELGLDDRTDRSASVTGDRDLLTQLIVNLVSNALDHGAPGVRVMITLDASDTEVVVRVSDDGPGIPVEERDKVFRRLYRLDRSRSTPGHGLGLSLVKAIVTLHGGSVALSDNAPGLVARVTLPRTAIPSVRATAVVHLRSGNG